MPARRRRVALTIVGATLLLAAVADAQAPIDDPIVSPLAAPANESIQVPSAGRAQLVTRVQAVPPVLMAAVARVSCEITDPLLAKYPVSIFRPADGRWVMALVPCSSQVPESRGFMFDRAVDAEPSPMMFPVVAPSGGFTASHLPGLLAWDAQTRTLTAWRGSETCPGRELRHSYRQGGGELNGFALSKVEHRRLRCATPESEWQMLWQAPVWKLQP